MFFSVLLILATIWTSSDGALSCKTDEGLECVFPFKSSTSSSEYNQCKAGSKGRTWCATAVKANLVYSAWGYCNLDTCKEVQSAEDSAKKIEAQGPCYACIERVAYGPPPHWQSLECIEPCVSEGVAVEPACFNCLVRTATRQCLAPCGAQTVLDSYPFPAVGSEGYPDVNIVNSLNTSVTVSVHYPSIFCHNDDDKGIAPGLSISLSRGICVVTHISATTADGTVCTPYEYFGTSYSKYAVITVLGGGCRVAEGWQLN